MLDISECKLAVALNDISPKAIKMYIAEALSRRLSNEELCSVIEKLAVEVDDTIILEDTISRLQDIYNNKLILNMETYDI